MKIIELTQGLVTLVDDADFDWLNQWKWQAHGCRGIKYARRSVYNKKTKKNHFIHMHRLILGIADPKIKADHRDRNSLNNQRSNLRQCTIGQNNSNKNSRRNTTSKYLGVYWSKIHKKWMARVRHNRKEYYAAQTDNEKEAAKAYNKKALELHGEFANLNIV